jgi:leader peptidase (prepilin peptidase)/N-methyltransferase
MDAERFADLILFLFGASIGSFLNVCIYRLPREDMSIKSPKRSVCFSCGEKIRWYDNIPILSYIWLRGRCRNCKTEFSIRYALVELLTAVLFVLIGRRFGLDVATPIYIVFTAALIVGSFIDIDHFILPDEITIPGIFIGLLLGVGIPIFFPDSSFIPEDPVDAVIGAVIGGGSLWSLGVIAKAVLRRDAMGFGDVKLMTMVGFLIGWRMTLLTLFLSAILGLLITLPIHIVKGKGRYAHLPYGPYLSLGAVLSLLWGEALFAWYWDSAAYLGDLIARLLT